MNNTMTKILNLITSFSPILSLSNLLMTELMCVPTLCSGFANKNPV